MARETSTALEGTLTPARNGRPSGVQVLIEQYLDFVTNRMFRESLLVHAERTPQGTYNLHGGRYEHLHFAASVPPVDGPTRPLPANRFGHSDRRDRERCEVAPKPQLIRTELGGPLF